MNKNEILELVIERLEEGKKTKKVDCYYKRNGKMVKRSYSDSVYTERYKELNRILNSESARIFVCAECKEKVCFDDLEYAVLLEGIEKFRNMKEDEYLCSLCYEEGMGEDL